MKRMSQRLLLFVDAYDNIDLKAKWPFLKFYFCWIIFFTGIMVTAYLLEYNLGTTSEQNVIKIAGNWACDAAFETVFCHPPIFLGFFKYLNLCLCHILCTVFYVYLDEVFQKNKLYFLYYILD